MSEWRRIILFSILCAIPALAQNTASIQGTVLDKASGTPIINAFVVANRVGLPPATGTAKSAQDGSFTIQNLPAGRYQLCARFVSGRYLDSCEWGQAASSLLIAAGQNSTGNILRSAAGSILKVRMQDTAQTLFQKNASGATPDLLMGIFARPGAWYPVRLVRRDSRGADYELPVPLDTPLALTVMSTHLKLTDSTGAAVPGTSQQTQFTHATGDPNPPSFTYTVAGLKP